EASRNKIDPNLEHSPLNVLNEWEKKGKSLAKTGLKVGLLDMLTMSMDMSIEMKKDLSLQLTSQGFPGLSQLVSTIKGTIRKILKRGKIKNIDEYYVTKDLLNDSKYYMSETDQVQIGQMME